VWQKLNRGRRGWRFLYQITGSVCNRTSKSPTHENLRRNRRPWRAPRYGLKCPDGRARRYDVAGCALGSRPRRRGFAGALSLRSPSATATGLRFGKSTISRSLPPIAPPEQYWEAPRQPGAWKNVPDHLPARGATGGTPAQHARHVYDLQGRLVFQQDRRTRRSTAQSSPKLPLRQSGVLILGFGLIRKPHQAG
jgi:hypothetical protein